MILVHNSLVSYVVSRLSFVLKHWKMEDLQFYLENYRLHILTLIYLFAFFLGMEK
jgi:hypothetical protein